MMKRVDDFLNRVTMYRSILYFLTGLAGVAVLSSLFGFLSFSLVAMVGSLLLLLIVCFLGNILLAKLYDIPVNHESSLITALILFFIIAPPDSLTSWMGLAIAGIAAMASKFVLVWRGAHIFNPAALGAFIVGMTGINFVSWWVATPIFFWFVLIGGVFLLRKVRRLSMFLIFFAVSITLFSLRGLELSYIIFSLPLIFFGMIMLTEPATSPYARLWQLVYAAGVGVLLSSGVVLFSQPYVALVIGNGVAFIVNNRRAVKLKLVSSKKLAPQIYEFVFLPRSPIIFQAGQYMEWTLPGVRLDSRGNRRTFSLASSPNEKYVRFAIRISDSGSQFKRRLLTLKKDEEIVGSHVAGDFILPKNHDKELVFIAGGIGITPFRSIVKDLVDKGERRDIRLFHLTSGSHDTIYSQVWQAAESLGISYIPLIDNERLSHQLLKEHILYPGQSIFYISGPPAMVRAYKKIAISFGVSPKDVHTDYFSGY